MKGFAVSVSVIPSALLDWQVFMQKSQCMIWYVLEEFKVAFISDLFWNSHQVAVLNSALQSPPSITSWEYKV